MQFVQSFLLVASSLLFVYVGYYAYTHRKTPGAFAFFLLMSATLIWSLGSAFELYAYTLQDKVFWRNIQQIGVFGVPISTVYFAVTYTRKPKNMKYVIAAAIPQLISVLLIFTNELHHLMRTECVLVPSAVFGESLVVHSTALGSALVSYNFALPLAAVAILLNYARKLSPGFRKQVYTIIFSFLYTFAVAFIKTTLFEQFNIYIHISVLYAPAALVMFFSVFNHRTLSLSPIARDKVFDVIDQGIIVMDETGIIIDINTYAIRTLENYLDIQNPLCRRMDDSNTQYPELNELLRRKKEGKLELHAKNNTGEAYISLSYYPLYSKQEKTIGSVIIINNITVQKLYERNLKDKAEKDYLTRLLNKFGFHKALQRYLSEGGLRRYSVLMIDIDNFKQINDTFGHAAGDAVLRNFTNVVTGIVRSEDIAGRLGGDEFAVVIPNITKETALQIAERIRTTVEAGQVVFNDQNTRYTISTGIADNDAEGLSFDEILRHADIALYQAKNQSRNSSVVYTKPEV